MHGTEATKHSKKLTLMDTSTNQQDYIQDSMSMQTNIFEWAAQSAIPASRKR